MKQAPPLPRWSNYPTTFFKRLADVAPATAAALFALAGILFIPYAGIQNDEALFSAPLFAPFEREYRVRLFHHDVALMVMSYVGTLKTWLYGAVFAIWRPSAWSVRLPMILVGALSLWLFWRLLERAAGRGAALAGCALLATDAAYLLTTVFDWGPVALQHLLLIGGALFVLAAAQDRSPPKLALGFFLFGLGMWDKALFSWTLGGLVIASLAVYPRQVWRLVSWRWLSIAVVSFALGALPLIIYNVRNPLKTFAGNARFSAENFVGKAQLLRLTLEGGSLLGYIVNEDWTTENPKQPRTSIERASVWLHGITGEHRRGLMLWALGALLLLAPWWWKRRRPVLFGLVFLIVAWLQMALTKDAGGGVHHVILLWPFPQFVAAIALARIAERLKKGALLAALIVGVVCLSNLLVLNQYFYQFLRGGAPSTWTDALAPLSASLHDDADEDVFVMDWGMFDNLRMLHEGRLRLLWGSTFVHDPAGARTLKWMLEHPHPVFITHAPGAEIGEQTEPMLLEMAAALGYRPLPSDIIYDSNGRAVFRILRFTRDANPG